MGQGEENHVYNNLTEALDKKPNPKAKWTVYLALCCLTACMGSFNFGYNIGCLNLPTPLIKDFFTSRFDPVYFSENLEYREQLNKFTQARLSLNPDSNVTDLVSGLNITQQEADLDVIRVKLDPSAKVVDKHNTFLWTVTNSLFVFGGMFGAFSSKYVLEFFGRKKGLLFHYIFSTLGGMASLIAPQFTSPYVAIGLIMVSRLLFGVQGGMMCGLVPTYLNEVAPNALRGSCGVINQLFITIGICISQVLGFRQLLGTKDLWEYILAFPLIPSLFGGFVLLFFFSETPKALLITNKDEDATRLVLQRLRNSTDVEDEIEEILKESKESTSDSAVGFKELFTERDYRWPLITALTLQLTQQLSGINAIFFYSDGIFRRAKIPDEHIQYAIFSTGFINVICTIAVVPLIEKLGRKPLLTYPMGLMLATFVALTACLIWQEVSIYISYLSIFFIILFICCFAVGLGPIPFVYASEVFRQEARGAALATCMTLNWISNLLLSLTFEYLAQFLGSYVFLVFFVIISFGLFMIITKVPETKNKSTEEIIANFNNRKLDVDDATGRPMLATSKV